MFMRSGVPLSLEESENTQIIPVAGETWDSYRFIKFKMSVALCLVLFSRLALPLF